MQIALVSGMANARCGSHHHADCLNAGLVKNTSWEQVVNDEHVQELF
jgi:hypothetical protein